MTPEAKKAKTQAIFYRDKELWLITGTVPEKPIICYGSTGDRHCIESPGHIKTFDWIATEANKTHCACRIKVEEYESTLARLKTEAIRVENQSIGIQLWWVQETPNQGISRAYWLKTKNEGEIYFIDAEVEHKCETCNKQGLRNCGYFNECGGPVAVLKPLRQEPPIVRVTNPDTLGVHPEPTEDELWREAALMVWGKTLVDAALSSKEFQKIKSKFKITRK